MREKIDELMMGFLPFRHIDLCTEFLFKSFHCVAIRDERTISVCGWDRGQVFPTFSPPPSLVYKRHLFFFGVIPMSRISTNFALFDFQCEKKILESDYISASKKKKKTLPFFQCYFT